MYKETKKLLPLLLCTILVCTASLDVQATEASSAAKAMQINAGQDIDAQAGSAENEEQKELTISNVEDFLTFAENCRLDSYSQNLSVVLEADIDLSGVEFESIPIFCGDFDGGSHTISGLKIAGEGSVQGLFRYVESTAMIHDLVVMGDVMPVGSQSTVGGIAGSNAGRIEDCNFYGQVSGADNIGGLVGINEMTGVLDNCRVKADIYGNHFVGGLAGINYGVIRNSVNLSPINTTAAQNTVEISDITMESLTGTESSATVTDIGGIAGTGSGVIRNCENSGTIGYQQMGYNIAGIAGSYSGYVADCVNYGDVFGRKEVGGIVGHMEPVVRLEYSIDTLQILQNQLGNMETLTRRTADNAQSSIDELDGRSNDLQQDLKDARTSIEELLKEGSEDFSYDADSVNAIRNNVSSSLSSMSENMKGMTSTSKDSLNSLSNNLQALTNQMNAINNTLSNASENLGGSFADVSDEDTALDITSKVENCINHGTVRADLNVGGIVGAIALESDLDAEEDIQIEGDISLHVEGELRSVILACENRGEVAVRKQNAGGIVGRMDMGLAKECLNVSTVEGEGADYVGGIAGQGLGYIRSCNVQCSLSGQSHVGGIAGAGVIVTDCRSMIRPEAVKEKLGAVLGLQEKGNTEEENPIRDNYYLVVGEDIGAIDGVSYAGLAEPLEEDAFFALENLHEEFHTVEVQFCFEDDRVKTVCLNWGDKLTEEKIPPIPDKAGYIGYWEGLEEMLSAKILFNETIEVNYIPKNAALQSEELGADNLPILLAQGEFVPNQKVVMEQLTDTPAWGEGLTVVEAWTYAVTPAGAATKLRYLLPQEAANGLQLQVRDSEGNWRQVSFAVDGSYLIFDVAEGDDAFCLVQIEPDYTWQLWLAAGGVFLLLILMVVWRRKSKKL